MNDIISADISEEREDLEATSENFIKNLKIKSIENKLENKY